MRIRQTLGPLGALLLLLLPSPAPGQTATLYSYDPLNRLAVASGIDGGVRLVYDASGNLLQATSATLETFAVSPAWGSTLAGARVFVRGDGSLAGVTVSVDGLPLPTTAVATIDDRTLSVAMPPHAAGWVSMTLTRIDGASRTLPQAFIYLDASAPPSDTDGDGMSDAFEYQFGFNPADPSDAAPDTDGDGRSNAQEAADGTHPRGAHTRYLAEGAGNEFFDQVIAIANPAPAAATVLLRFLRLAHPPVTHVLSVPPTGRATLRTENVPGMEAAEFSTVIESDLPVVVDRTMTWDDTAYGSHAETSQAEPALTWYLAEGATKANFDLWYLLQNPSLTADATVRITYLQPSGIPPIVAPEITLPRDSRTNIHVDAIPGLEDTDVSAVIEVTNGVPILVERAMYTSGPRMFEAGHVAAGVTAPAVAWLLAEGATGDQFDEFILLANPTPTPTVVRVAFLQSAGTACTKDYPLGASGRETIWVNYQECPAGSGQYPFEFAELSAVVTSLDPEVPILVERAMWWPRTGWTEGHVSAGTTITGTKWALAEGEMGGPRNASTWILVANTSAWAGRARVTLLFEDGTTDALDVDVAANSRTTVGGFRFPRAAGRRFGAIVEAIATGGNPPPQVVVERAMYTDSGGVHWAAGTNAVATRLQ